MARQLSFRKREVKGRADDIDELARLRRGSATHMAEDVGEQPGFIMPFGRPQLLRDTVTRQPRTYSMPQMEEVLLDEQNEQLPPPPELEGNLNIEEQGSSPLEDFFAKLDYATAPQTFSHSDQLYQNYLNTGTPYAMQSLADGTARYIDGSIGAMPARPRATGSHVSGGVMMDDGTIKGGFQGNQSLAGVAGLSQALFGQQQPVTQAFGNINPGMGYAGNAHRGTDFRTRDLTDRNLKLPIDAEVVDVAMDDGRNPYGNSVLLRLPTGEMIRASHLSQIANLQPGQRLPAGTVFGIPGNTGNSTGEHLDLEYYNADGQLSDPSTFNFQGLAQQAAPAMSTAQPLEAMKPQYRQDQPQQAQNRPVQQPTAPQQQFQPWATPIGAAIQGTVASPKASIQPGSPARQNLASGVEAVAQNSGLGMELGASEMIDKGWQAGKDARLQGLAQQPKTPYEQRGVLGKARQLAGNVSERIGDVLGIPESNFSETLAGGTTKRTNQALASEFGGEQPAQVPGIRQNIADIGKDSLAGIQQIFSSALNKIGSDQPKAGAGLQALQGNMQFGQNANMSMRPDMSDLTDRRQVGEMSGGNLLPSNMSAQQAQSRATSDIRDAFFKNGQSQEFGSFMKPGMQNGMGISLDMMSDDFYTDPNRVKSVFGNTHLSEQANQKYAAWKAAEEARIAEEARREEEARKRSSSSSKSSSKGDSISSSRSKSSTSGQGSTSVTQASGRTVSAPGGSTLRVDSSGETQAVRNISAPLPGGRTYDMSTPTKSVSAQLAKPKTPAPQPKTSLFSKLKTAVSNLFRR